MFLIQTGRAIEYQNANEKSRPLLALWSLLILSNEPPTQDVEAAWDAPGAVPASGFLTDRWPHFFSSRKKWSWLSGLIFDRKVVQVLGIKNNR
ncbi:hypothetical protein C5B42_02305 [Candidatus Cerribacteria bacterium 'Amazon FNV 2010 28 9']|uniref:Uncharacterized protein n=1 Tax=Candidatus Cerribacteria bacterium 'Amazon FNV 2010 28 9' TaxID=2081795 RepID=A0A317JPL0_9BACT|nr:MAG: hypothetical protein C5B42_02305 [Candidatus Cerribacteria bacterium 'Amazon FNV 2010 28 9']